MSFVYSFKYRLIVEATNFKRLLFMAQNQISFIFTLLNSYLQKKKKKATHRLMAKIFFLKKLLEIRIHKIIESSALQEVK